MTMTKTLLTTVALLGALSFPAFAEDSTVSTTPTPNDLASWQAMDSAVTNSTGEMAKLKNLTTVGDIVVVNTATFNESTNEVESLKAMMEKGKAIAPEVQAAINANPGLLAKIKASQPGLDLATVYAINVTAEGSVYLYTS